MQKFLKYFLATVLGAVVSFILFIIIILVVVGSITAKQQKEFVTKKNSVLVLKLDKEIVDRKPSSPFNLSTMRKEEKIGLNDILRSIKKAKEDKNIEGIYLNLTFIPSGLSNLEEIRNALEDFKESGKFIITYSEYMDQSAYYVASVSDKIYINPTGIMTFVGLRAQMLFFRGTLDKLGIEPKVLKYGQFKSAGESFVNKKMSDANREQIHRMIECMWKEVVKDIAKSRNLSEERLNIIADSILANDPESLVKTGLVDSLAYETDVLNILMKKVDVEKEDDMHLVKLSDYSKTDPLKDKKSKKAHKNKIAVIYASGTIISGEGKSDDISSDKMSKTIKKLRKDSTVKAIVLRVNSPGGSAIASDVILNELKLTKKDKPVIVSMGNVAASGGYYISCAADTILCNPTTITGSIGVIGIFFNTEGFINKLGITVDVEKTNEFSDLLSGVRPMRKQEEDMMQHTIDYIYETFITHVAEGRSLKKERVDEIGQGRVWTGVDAKEIGLVDGFGGLSDAIDIAIKKANVGDKYVIEEYPELKSPIEEFFEGLSGDTKAKIIKEELGANADYYLKIQDMVRQQGILARMPFYIDIY